MTKQEFLNLKPGDKIFYHTGGKYHLGKRRGTVREVGIGAIRVSWHDCRGKDELVPLHLEEYQLKYYSIDRR